MLLVCLCESCDSCLTSNAHPLCDLGFQAPQLHNEMQREDKEGSQAAVGRTSLQEIVRLVWIDSIQMLVMFTECERHLEFHLGEKRGGIFWFAFYKHLYFKFSIPCASLSVCSQSSPSVETPGKEAPVMLSVE